VKHTFQKVTPTKKLNGPDPLISPKAVASSSKPDQQSWIDGYICSICGFELPPGFEEERLEHSDFHLAETLQQEEAVDGTRHIPNERYLCLGIHSKKCCFLLVLQTRPLNCFLLV
jgi:Ca2+-transporting ATPase/DNA polymerase kappa